MKNKLLIYLLLCVLFEIAAFSCKKNEATDPRLISKWMLVSIQDTKNNQIISYPDSLLQKEYIEFKDYTTIHVHTTCNGGNGKYFINGHRFTVSDLMTTLRGCSAYKWDQYLLWNLYDAYEYRITSDELEIYSSGSYHLKFARTDSL